MAMADAMAKSAAVAGSGMGWVGAKLLNARPRPVVLVPVSVMRTLSTPAGSPEKEKVQGRPSRAGELPTGEFCDARSALDASRMSTFHHSVSVGVPSMSQISPCKAEMTWEVL